MVLSKRRERRAEREMVMVGTEVAGRQVAF